MYRLEALLYNRIITVTEEAEISYQARMFIYSKILGKDIRKFDDITPGEAIQLIDALTKGPYATKGRRKTRQVDSADGARSDNSDESISRDNRRRGNSNKRKRGASQREKPTLFWLRNRPKD